MMALVLLATALTLLQAFDLHTTIEALKYGRGWEENPRLQWLNDPRTPIAAKFWELGKLKLLAAALGWGLVGIPGIFPELAGLCLFILAAPNTLYAPIVLSNWRILRGVMK